MLKLDLMMYGGRGAWSSNQELLKKAEIKVNRITKKEIADDKIYKYLLTNDNHKEDFIRIGYTKENGEKLKQDILNGFENNKRIDVKYNEETKAIKFNVRMKLGIKKKRYFVTGWQIDRGKTTARFITAFDNGKEE